MKTFLKIAFVVSAVLFVAVGCSSGGNPSGGNALVYNGKATRAKLTKENTKDFLEIIQNSLSGVAASQNSTHTRSFGFSARMSKKISGSLAKKTEKVLGTKTVKGTVNGTVNVTVEEIGTYTQRITLIYTNFSNQPGTTIDGTEVQDITVDASGTVQHINIDYQMYTVKAGEESGTVDGTIMIETTDTGAKSTENYLLKNNKTNEMVKYENFVMQFDEENHVLSYLGKVYDSKYGFVDVNTVEKMEYNDDDTHKAMGKIMIKGNASTATIGYADDDRIRVEIDKDNDGTVDFVNVYRLNEKRELETVPNSAPSVKISFPKEIFTDTNMSRVVTIKTHDPDHDAIVSVKYKWSVNGVVQGEELEISSNKYKKHDKLKLTVTVEDERGKKTTQSKEQEVLNSRPIIKASFSNLQLTIGDTANLEYTVTDADGDDVTIDWKHYLDGQIDEYYAFDCRSAIDDYDHNHPDHTYETLTPYEQEDFNNTYCPKRIEGTVVTFPFVHDHSFEAVAPGAYLHEMIVSDGEYNRTAILESNITRTDIVDKQINHHDPYALFQTFNVYMRDFDGDGHKDLIYMIPFVKQHYDDNSTDYRVPTLVIEYRNGDTILGKESYEVNATELDNFYVGDVNGNGKLDILLTHTNGYSPPTNKRFSVMFQRDQGRLAPEKDIVLSNYDALAISDVTGDGRDDILLNAMDEYNNNLGIQIFSEEGNITLQTSFHQSHQSGDKVILIKDLDNNGKKDIIVANKETDSSMLEIEFNVFYQDDNGSYSRKEYTAFLGSAEEGENVKDIIISDLDGKDEFLIASTRNIYILAMQDDGLTVIKKLNYFNRSTKDSPKILDPVDIDHDGKKDLIVLDTCLYADMFVGIFIQKSDMDFFVEQNYSFDGNDHGGFDDPGYVLDDINNDGKYEIFFNAGDENLSAIYFK